ncbi:MAG: fibronectin type III domain-containing protein [Candidatus Riflebacteria bacterium]|nr:fibronectin type III domain-containing protein [Candidatus Riflebacteria bacterium]
MVTLLALSVGGLMLRGRPAGLPSPTVSPTAPTAPTVRRPTLSDLAPIVGPTWLTVVFTTPEPLAARLSVEPGGLTTADAAPRHSHRLTVRGLAPGTRYDMRLVALDGVELASRRVKAPPAERVAAELVRLLEWSMQALSRATEMAMGPQSDRAARERFGLMWRARCQSWAAAPDLRFWSDALEAVNDRIFLRFETTVATHERLVRRIERLLDLERFLKAASPVDPGLPTDRIRLPAPLTSPPAALEPVAALRFADGGAAAGRPALETAARAVAVDPPARFSADKAGFLSGGMHDAASRYDYEHPATWGPRRRSRELYLRYRVSGGSPVEKLVVQFLDGSAWIEAACLRVPEPPAPFEGWLRIDPRLLDRPARVRIVAERHSPGFLTRGIVLDHLALYAR